ncbi:putative DHH family protein [Lyophyllum shimeji]|uniref:DHH family protein n=1 Tax=Lyophyllum shimeji TaxID=47721 RepID=A0A9P3PR10_LYOSH|nr:putative DHH family protein [Lyophyllum shimeji]
MRHPLRRLSHALRLSKPRDMSTTGTSDPSALAQFLSSAKEKYLSDISATPSRGGEWTVVMGNEAGDLDSLASSIGFAWFQSEVHKKPTIPLLQLERDDLDLRAENLYALHQAGISDPKSQLLFLTDLAGHSPFPRTPSHWSTTTASARPTRSPTRPTNPRTIVPCGSCASHVAELISASTSAENVQVPVPAELATLLLSAILIDTNGLKPGGKAVATDNSAAFFLAPRSTLAAALPATVQQDDPKALHDAQAIREFTRSLADKKTDVSHLSGRDLLRRDYKDYVYTLAWMGEGGEGTEVKAGLASVPLSLKVWGSDGKLEEAVIPWMQERGIAVLGVLTSYRAGGKKGKNGKGKHKRQMAWVVHDAAVKEDSEAEAVAGKEKGIEVEKIAEMLWKGLEASKELKLKKHKKFDVEKAGRLPAGAKARVYKQGNVDATRKVTAPLLKNILEAPEAADK